jgi:pimeloyl-ACP methyl ester carboxylesterase
VPRAPPATNAYGSVGCGRVHPIGSTSQPHLLVRLLTQLVRRRDPPPDLAYHDVTPLSLAVPLALLAARAAEDGAAGFQRADVDGTRLEYRVGGSGEPVVLIHNGVGVDWYRDLAREPSLAGYRVLVYHRAGYAGSGPATGAMDLGREAAQLRALLRHLGIARAHVVGHSSSGLIALRLALDAPEAVHSLVLLEPALLAVPSAPGVGEAVALYRSGEKERALDVFLRATSGSDYRQALERALPGAFAQAAAAADRFFGEELPALRAWRFGPEEAKRVSRPVLLARGERTDDINRRRHLLLREWLPAAEPFVLSGAGHLMHVENPRGMAEGLASFFARHPIR